MHQLTNYFLIDVQIDNDNNHLELKKKNLGILHISPSFPILDNYVHQGLLMASMKQAHMVGDQHSNVDMC